MSPTPHSRSLRLLLRQHALYLLAALVVLLLSTPAVAASGDFAGYWQGQIVTPAGDLGIQIQVRSTPDGWEGTFDIPQQGMQALPLRNLEIEGETLRFTLPIGAGDPRYEGTRIGEEIQGTFQQAGQSFTLNFAPSEPPADQESAPLQPPVELGVGDWAAGHWEGAIQLPNGGLEISIDLLPATESTPWSGTFDIPQQGAEQLPLRDIRVTADSLHFRLSAGPGDPRFEGDLEDGEIRGKFLQAGASLALTFAREGKAGDPEASMNRPQHPQPPFPYRSEDVTYSHGGTKLAATLTLPEGEGPFPAVLLLTGSGLQDRDETLFGHKPFLVLADHLTRAGIAVLRADDRGFGESEGEVANATMLDFMEDALTGVRFLTSRSEIDPQRIGLIGHSEGGVVGPLAAQRAQNDDSINIAFLVLLGAPGVPGDDVIVLQSELMAVAAGMSPEQGEEIAALQRQVFDLMKQESDTAVLRQQLIELLTPMVGAETATAQSAPLLTPWFRHFITHDPASVLRTLHTPILALNGGLDKQVDVEQNFPPIAAALESAGNTDVTLQKLEGLNHLFQPAETGTLTEYAQIETTLAPELLETVTAWIVERFGNKVEAGGALP